MRPSAMCLMVILMKGLFLFLSYVALAESKPYNYSSTLLAHTLNGTYQGRYLPSFDQDLFLGVPFANTPRLNNPTSVNTT